MCIQTQIILLTNAAKKNEVHEAEFQEKVTFSQISRKFSAFSYADFCLQILRKVRHVSVLSSHKQIHN